MGRLRVAVERHAQGHLHFFAQRRVAGARRLDVRPPLGPVGRRGGGDARSTCITPSPSHTAGEPRRLTTNADLEYAPAFSRDGSRLAFVTWDDAEGGHVWTVPFGP